MRWLVGDDEYIHNTTAAVDLHAEDCSLEANTEPERERGGQITRRYTNTLAMRSAVFFSFTLQIDRRH